MTGRVWATGASWNDDPYPYSYRRGWTLVDPEEDPQRKRSRHPSQPQQLEEVCVLS